MFRHQKEPKQPVAGKSGKKARSSGAVSIGAIMAEYLRTSGGGQDPRSGDNLADSASDQELIDRCRNKVRQANTVMDGLEKDIKKLEAYNQVMGIVRRNFKIVGNYFWNSPRD